MNRPASGIPVVLLLLSVNAGCDLFETRQAQPPAQTKSSYDTPVTKEIVLDNLKSAIEEYNVDNYMRCFVDTAVRQYEFIPSQETQATYAAVFSHWNLDAERQYFVHLGPPTTGTPSLSLIQQSIVSSSDSVTYVFSYSLVFPHNRSNVPQQVAGTMQLSLGTDNQGLWSIYRWQDFKAGPDSTWSYWKAVFSGS